MQAEEPNLPDHHKRGYGIHIVGIKLSPPQVPFEVRSSHLLGALGGLEDRKGPGKDGQIVGSIAPPTAVEVIKREGAIFLTGVPAVKVAMTKAISRSTIACSRPVL
jgi:hypothetical protein